MTKISNNKPETEKMNIEHRTPNIERRMKDKKVGDVELFYTIPIYHS